MDVTWELHKDGLFQSHIFTACMTALSLDRPRLSWKAWKECPVQGSVNCRLSHETGVRLKHWILNFGDSRLHPGFSHASLRLKDESSCSGTTHDPCPIKCQKKFCWTTTNNICFQIPAVKVSRHSFYLQLDNLQRNSAKKEAEQCTHTPCINNVRKDTTCSSEWP